jgi:hypothetical protein
MRRKRFRKQPVAVAMLPFLAVLICTMGSLILLLVILVQNARVEADTVKSRRQQEETEQECALREQTEDAQWRKDILLEARERDTKKLSDARLELSHLEEHTRRLQSQWEELTRQVEDLQRLEGEKEADTSAAEAELARLQSEIEREQQRLEEARRAAADRPRSFSIVPVPRTNGTLRRPIYIECTANGVILQPEGIVLGAKDFLPPLGPGNALDAALRATREYLAQHGGVDAHGEPYPLMLVRPNGAVAYAAARDALRSWEHEFGYELLDEEMQLSYPEPDPALADEVRRAVEIARRRQELLARSAPTRFRRLRQAMLAEGNPGASLIGGGKGAGISGGSADSPGGSGMGNGSRSGGGTSSGGGTFSGGGRGRSNSFGDGRGGSYSQGGGRGGSNSPGGSGDGATSGQSTAQTGTGQGTGAQQNASGTPRGRASFGGGFFGNPSSAQGGASGESPGAAGQQRGDAQGTGGAGARSGPQTAGGGGNGGPLQGSHNTQSMAAQRGSNWALRDGGGRANAYTRPVRVTLTPDRLYILSDRSGRPVKTIPLTGAMEQQMEALVEAVHNQVDGWGTAPVRGYWLPVLTVQVVPAAEGRFQELRTLLDDSGLQVERKAP